MAKRSIPPVPRPSRRIVALVGVLAFAGASLTGLVTPAAAAEGAPYAPTNVRAAIVNSTQIELRFTAPTGSLPISGYVVYRNGVQVPSSVRIDGSVGEATATLGTQPTGRDLYLQVQVIATNGMRSVKTAPVVVNIAGAVKPSAPTGVSVVTQPSGQPLLSWSPSADGVGATTYLVFRNGVLAATQAATSVAFDAEPVAIDLYYQVQARDPAGNLSAKTAPIVFRIPGPDTVRPTIPTDVHPDLRLNATVEVSWTASTDNVGVVGYIVFRNSVEVARTTGTSVRLLDQPHGVTLGYQVQAYDAAGNRSAKTLPVYLAF
jgi:hypothetical protein